MFKRIEKFVGDYPITAIAVVSVFAIAVAQSTGLFGAVTKLVDRGVGSFKAAVAGAAGKDRRAA